MDVLAIHHLKVDPLPVPEQPSQEETLALKGSWLGTKELSLSLLGRPVVKEITGIFKPRAETCV